MREFLNVMIYPHQRLERVRTEVNGLSDAVMRLYGLDLDAVCWAGCREGVLARFEEDSHPEMLVRIPTAKLDCTALLLYMQEGGGWGYQLCYKGTVEDAFASMPGSAPDSATPEQHAARLARRFRLNREKLLACLTQENPVDGSMQEGTEFLNHLAPWAFELLASDRLAPAPAASAAPAAPVPDRSSPHLNAPDRLAGPPERRLEDCLPFLAGVKVLERSWAFPRSLLYFLFPQKRPAPKLVPHKGWSAQNLEAILEDFYCGRLDRLELEFTLNGAGTYVRRMQKTVYHPYLLTLELIREKGRCMCLLLDGQEPTVYRLIADRDPYMNVDIKDLKKTVFHGQSVEEYVVFSAPDLTPIRQEVALLLSRLDCRDGVLSATRRMGVWSCEGLRFNQGQHQQQRDVWCL